MTWKSNSPIVYFLDKTYKKGIKLAKKEKMFDLSFRLDAVLGALHMLLSFVVVLLVTISICEMLALFTFRMALLFRRCSHRSRD